MLFQSTLQLASFKFHGWDCRSVKNQTVWNHTRKDYCAVLQSVMAVLICLLSKLLSSPQNNIQVRVQNVSFCSWNGSRLHKKTALLHPAFCLSSIQFCCPWRVQSIVVSSAALEMFGTSWSVTWLRAIQKQISGQTIRLRFIRSQRSSEFWGPYKDLQIAEWKETQFFRKWKGN